MPGFVPARGIPATSTSVLTEVQLHGRLRTNRIPDESLIAVRTKIVTRPVIDVVTHQGPLEIFGAFQDFVDLKQMIAIFVDLIRVHWVHLRLDFQSDHVAQVLNGIKNPLTSVTSIVNHHSVLRVNWEKTTSTNPWHSFTM
jgi:hypothetical protein